MYINATIYESIKGVTNHLGRTHVGTRVVVHGKADTMAIRDSRADMAVARLMSIGAQTCEAFHAVN